MLNMPDKPKKNPMVTFQNVTFTYPGEKQAVIKQCSFGVKAGKRTVIEGESGTGKTTLFRLLLGFVSPDEGSILFRGQPVNPDTVDHIRQETAWLPQDLDLGEGKVEALIRFPFGFEANQGISPDRDQIAHTFDALGLDFSLLQSSFSDLSTGQRQRVGITICHLLNKPLLLLDEPTSALDTTSKQKVANLLFSDGNRTILSTSHDPWWLERCDNRVEL